MKLKSIEDFITYQSILTEKSRERISTIAKPERMALRNTPKDLNSITLGQLIELWGITSDMELFCTSAVSVFAHCKGYSEAKAARMERRMKRRLRHVRTGKAIGWMNFIQSELLRINDMWQECDIPISRLDREAGAESLNYGFFSIIDAYAQRQRITDHDDVLKVEWVKVWQCLKKDADIAKFQIRRQQILDQQQKQKFK